MIPNMLLTVFKGVFKTMCEIDITYYPFDEQQCKLVFGSWSYNIGKVEFH